LGNPHYLLNSEGVGLGRHIEESGELYGKTLIHGAEVEMTP
jgi:hypothetical protein